MAFKTFPKTLNLVPIQGNESLKRDMSSFNIEVNKFQSRRPIRKSVQFLVSPQTSVFLDDVLCQNQQTPTGLNSNCELVCSLLNTFQYCLFVPNKVKFNYDTGRFEVTKGSLIAKVLSYIWLLLFSLYISLIFFNEVDKKQTVKMIVSKVTWACYTLFDLCIIFCLRHKGKDIAKLLSECNKASNLCDQLSSVKTDIGKKEKRFRQKYIVYIICSLSLFYAVVYTLIVVSVYTSATTNLFKIFLDITSDPDKPNEENYDQEGNRIFSTLFGRFTSNSLASVILTCWFSVAIIVELIWIMFLVMTALWGNYFKRLVQQCIYLIQTSKVDMTEGIQLYSRITLLLEDFNRIFGANLLWIVIACVLYTALTLGESLAGTSNGYLFNAVNTVGFVPFLATLYTASDLHRSGHLLPSVIKRQMTDLRLGEDERTLQMIQGTNVIQFDVLSNNLGMKGAGFFTISYQFIGSLVGVIITYSLVTVQFKLGEIMAVGQ